MSQEVLCNGAGEMPGHEGEGSCDERYEAWLDRHDDTLIEKYKESIEDIDDVPDDFLQSQYESWAQGD